MRIMLWTCGILLVLGTGAWVLVRAQSPGAPIGAPDAPALGAHVLVGQEQERADPVARTPPLATAPGGSSLLAIVAGYAINDVPPRDSFGNRWRRLGKPVVYRGYQGTFDARAYLAQDARGGARHTVEVAKPGRPAGELTLIVIEALRAARLVDQALVYPEPAFRQFSGEVETQGPALLVAVWLGDGDGLRHVARPGDGFRLIEDFTQLPPNSAVQAAVAVREVTQAGRYRASWYAAPQQGAILWLFALAHESARPGSGNSASSAIR